MHERDADFSELQYLLDATYESVRSHLMSIIGPDRRLRARRYCELVRPLREFCEAGNRQWR